MRFFFLVHFVARVFGTRIRNKITLPYLLLALLIAVAMTYVAVRLTVGTLQDRLDNRLVEAGQATSDGLVSVETRHLEQLRTIAFTRGVPAAVAEHDMPRLEARLSPIWANAGLHSVVVFDSDGRALLHWQRPIDAPSDMTPQALPRADLDSWWLVQQLVQVQSDAAGDKFSAFEQGQLWTVAPVRRRGEFVGGVIVGTPVDVLLQELENRSHASITTLYDSSGIAVATTQTLIPDVGAPPIPTTVLRQLRTSDSAAQPQHVQGVAAINGRDYQLAYSPLRVRRAVDGFFSVALSRSFIVDGWALQRVPLLIFVLVMVLAVIIVGLATAQRITRPLRNLVDTAQAVASGELAQRSNVDSHDEIGVLARSFNQMTSRLLHLYETSRTLSAQSGTRTILTQTNAAVQPLVPHTTAVALLRDHDGWHYSVPERHQTYAAYFAQVPVCDDQAMLHLVAQATTPVAIAAHADAVQVLRLPQNVAEICYIALTVQEHTIGLLVLLHRERGVFAPSVLQPLAAIASMAATALHNTKLYTEVQAEGTRRRAIIESIADGVLVCDAERNVVLMNPAAEALLKIQDWNERRYHFDQLPLEPIIDVADASGRQGRYTAHGKTLRASGAQLPASMQGLGGDVIVLHDISAEAAMERAKNDLIALVSHELRTPLTSVQSALDMLANEIGGPLSPLQRELADTALRQGRVMGSLIDKAVLIANIETNNLVLDRQPTSIRTVVDVALAPVLAAALAASVELIIDIPADLPLVLVDPAAASTALRQIIDNAITYGGGAPVRIVARAHRTSVVLAVRDFGPGIADADLPHLFQRLRRNANSANVDPRGLGLGLVIARELVERQGGTISVQSRIAQGSLFCITLPEMTDAASTIFAA